MYIVKYFIFIVKYFLFVLTGNFRFDILFTIMKNDQLQA